VHVHTHDGIHRLRHFSQHAHSPPARSPASQVDGEHTATVFYRDQACRNGRNEYEEFSPHKPSEWEPKCLVLLIEPDSLSALRDELVKQGRVLVHPVYARFLTHLNPDLHTPHTPVHTRLAMDTWRFLCRRIDVNYTTATSPNPDLAVSSTNCALGHVMLDLYEHDRVGQGQRDLLVFLQTQLAQARIKFDLYEKIYLGYVQTTHSTRTHAHARSILTTPCVCVPTHAKVIGLPSSQLAAAARVASRGAQRAAGGAALRGAKGALRAAARGNQHYRQIGQ
jgi:hypothetical protein